MAYLAHQASMFELPEPVRFMYFEFLWSTKALMFFGMNVHWRVRNLNLFYKDEQKSDGFVDWHEGKQLMTKTAIFMWIIPLTRMHDFSLKK